MLKLKISSVYVFVLFTCNVVAQDVYITGGDSAALQAAIDAANTPGSQVTIHLEAGQVFENTPWFINFSGNLNIEGNGAIFGRLNVLRKDPLGSIAADGAVTMKGVTFVNVGTGLNCFFIHNLGSLYLERITFTHIEVATESALIRCDTEELLLNEGSAELANVSFIGTRFWAVQGSVIRALENASTSVSHLTVVDTTYLLKGDSQIAVLRSASEGSISVSNSIILANESSGENLFPCVGPITDNGGNFSSPGECGFSGGLIDRDSLRHNIEKGHDAWVIPLHADSIAVSAGNSDYCQKLDGRGFERDVPCDSGAYEVMASNHGGELGRGGISGFYYTPESDGNYIQVQRAYDGNVVVIWNTFDASGAQAWINAIGSYQDGVVMAEAYRNLGGVLQPGAGASGGTETEWGTLKVTAHNCWNITVEYESTDPEFGSGTFEAQRLAYVHDLGCSEW
ncbi:MAG: choice-of-anchor Q domain-containing protein [Lysobacterales bacterium]